MESASWKLEDAKARFSHVVDSAMRGRVQHVTRRGKPAVVILAERDFQALSQNAVNTAPSFLDHLLAMPKPSAIKPLPASERKAKATRTQIALREVDFS